VLIALWLLPKLFRLARRLLRALFGAERVEARR
jgi:hypothetical protein